MPDNLDAFESAFGLNCARRASQMIEATRALGGEPVTTFQRETAIANKVRALATGLSPERVEAATRVCQIGVRLLDTADTTEVVARAIHDLHIIAFALAGDDFARKMAAKLASPKSGDGGSSDPSPALDANGEPVKSDGKVLPIGRPAVKAAQ